MLIRLSNHMNQIYKSQIYRNFTRKKINKLKLLERTKKLASEDGKMIKLSAKGKLAKSDIEKMKERETNILNLKKFDLKCEQKITNQDIFDINDFKNKNIINLHEEPQRMNDKLKEILIKNSVNKVNINHIQTLPKTINDSVKKEGDRLFKKVDVKYNNYEDVFNKNYDIKQYENDNLLNKRVGLMGIKQGMMTIWDDWGKAVPVSVIHIDRNQIINIVKRPYDKDFINIQVGQGSKSLKRIKKPMIGQFLKHNIPPKRDLMEFKIHKENILPIGYMLSVRHFTPGQFVDVRGLTKNRGIQGVMRRWGFKGQPASHGNSLSHRKGGSIGNCQDPGRVFKNKRMAGRMGNKLRWQRNLMVYRIDWERSLIYIKGSIPGKTGNPIVLKDCIFNPKLNQGLINYPTFIKEDKPLANITQALADFIDPSERWDHENCLPKQLLKEDE